MHLTDETQGNTGMSHDQSLRRHHRAMASRRSTPSARGFALVEVLVAVLLFAIGILGLVGLQASMTRAQTDSKVRADAANLMDELATLMWSDLGSPPVLANLTAYNGGACTGNTRCSSWIGKLGTTLPGGTLTTLAVNGATDSTNPSFGEVIVEIAWTLPNSSTPHKYAAVFNVAATSGP
jgi:type IV pilus assembly protein PilV